MLQKVSIKEMVSPTTMDTCPWVLYLFTSQSSFLFQFSIHNAHANHITLSFIFIVFYMHYYCYTLAGYRCPDTCRPHMLRCVSSPVNLRISWTHLKPNLALLIIGSQRFPPLTPLPPLQFFYFICSFEFSISGL